MLSFFLFIASVGLPGLAVVSFLWPRYISGLRTVSLIFGIGTALVSFELLLYFVILRQPYSIYLNWFFAFQSLAALGIALWQLPWKEHFSFDKPKFRFLNFLLGILIAIFVFFSGVQALGKQPVNFYYLAFWEISEKILLHD